MTIPINTQLAELHRDVGSLSKRFAEQMPAWVTRRLEVWGAVIDSLHRLRELDAAAAGKVIASPSQEGVVPATAAPTPTQRQVFTPERMAADRAFLDRTQRAGAAKPLELPDATAAEPFNDELPPF